LKRRANHLFSLNSFISHFCLVRISTLCIQRIYPLSKQIDGAVITSNEEENLNCVLTFHTETVLQRFMLRFEKLALDCNDHLFIFDGDLAVGNYKVNISRFAFKNHKIKRRRNTMS
ncbi:uncharacterized protein B4U79_06997, partial [Dinothrombium tinctorium]